MDEEKAREILKNCVRPNNELFNCVDFIKWPSWPGGKNVVTLDSQYSPEQLEAIVWWMKNMKVKD